jgi:beta-lactamase superfamily II metal-dependent hydrolase
MYTVSDSGPKLSSANQYCILQAAGHGTDYATSAELLHWSTPEAAIITCAQNEPPGGGTLHRLQAAGASIWRTDLTGMISVTTDGATAPQITAGKPTPSD